MCTALELRSDLRSPLNLAQVLRRHRDPLRDRLLRADVPARRTTDGPELVQALPDVCHRALQTQHLILGCRCEMLLLCRRGSSSPSGSVSISQCLCSKGLYNSKHATNEVVCETCTAGSSCPTIGTVTANLTICKGWYRTSSSSVDLRQCPDGSRETSGCVGGSSEHGSRDGEGPCKPCAAARLT